MTLQSMWHSTIAYYFTSLSPLCPPYTNLIQYIQLELPFCSVIDPRYEKHHYCGTMSSLILTNSSSLYTPLSVHSSIYSLVNMLTLDPFGSGWISAG